MWKATAFKIESPIPFSMTITITPQVLVRVQDVFSNVLFDTPSKLANLISIHRQID